MYGIIIEGVRYMIREKWGEAMVDQVMEKCQLSSHTFSTHERYSEKMMPNMLIATCEVTNESMETIGILAGRYFVHFMMKNGYGELLQVMGRRFGDFLKGLDNLHEYFRFSYPKIRPPSFYCSKETATSLTIHYRSRRIGYISYVMGQLIELAKIFFEQDVSIQMTNKQQKGSFQFVVLRVSFDNSGLEIDNKLKEKSSTLNEFLPVDSLGFLSMFPYFIAFTKRMEVKIIGEALMKIVPNLVTQTMEEQFDLQRPCIKFTWDGCTAHLNCMFQMESLYPITKKANKEKITFKVNDLVEDKIEVPEEEEEAPPQNPEEDDGELPYLQLRGPMIYLKNCDMMVYLPTVVVEKLDSLFEMGLYLDDYGEADCNKEIIMASVQKSDDLKDLLKSEKERSLMLGGMMREIDAAKRKAKELLGTMMPKEVANDLLNTGKASTICFTYDEVTVAFAKVCDFLTISSHLPAAEVVNLLNHIYSCFDEIITRHGVYKVETIGESYMISCGCPYKTEFHGEYIADTALDMITSVKNIDFGGLKGKKIQMKIGIMSGPCVGGVVGTRAPRFCLFGDCVNCASRMESHNKQAMTIQLGQKAKECMDTSAPQKFKFKHRGVISVKGKGEMKAYGLIGKAGRPRYQTDPIVLPDELGDEERALYTPIEEEDQDRASTMSRMSISKISQTSRASGGTTDSRGTSRAVSEFSVTEETEAVCPSRPASPKTKGNKIEGVLSGKAVAEKLSKLERQKLTMETISATSMEAIVTSNTTEIGKKAGVRKTENQVDPTKKTEKTDTKQGIEPEKLAKIKESTEHEKQPMDVNAVPKGKQITESEVKDKEKLVTETKQSVESKKVGEIQQAKSKPVAETKQSVESKQGKEVKQVNKPKKQEGQEKTPVESKNVGEIEQAKPVAETKQSVESKPVKEVKQVNKPKKQESKEKTTAPAKPAVQRDQENQVVMPLELETKDEEKAKRNKSGSRRMKKEKPPLEPRESEQSDPELKKLIMPDRMRADERPTEERPTPEGSEIDYKSSATESQASISKMEPVRPTEAVKQESIEIKPPESLTTTDNDESEIDEKSSDTASQTSATKRRESIEYKPPGSLTLENASGAKTSTKKDSGAGAPMHVVSSFPKSNLVNQIPSSCLLAPVAQENRFEKPLVIKPAAKTTNPDDPSVGLIESRKNKEKVDKRTKKVEKPREKKMANQKEKQEKTQDKKDTPSEKQEKGPDKKENLKDKEEKPAEKKENPKEKQEKAKEKKINSAGKKKEPLDQLRHESELKSNFLNEVKSITEQQKIDSISSSETTNIDQAPLPPIIENGAVSGKKHKNNCLGTALTCKCAQIKGDMKMKTKVCRIM